MNNLSEVQIDSKALVQNLQALTSLLPNEAWRAAVVKGNAYGHGMKEVVQVLEDHVDFFQVDDVAELAELRKLTERTALVLGYVPLSQIEEAIALNADLAIYDTHRLSAISEAGKKLGRKPVVHLKIDALLGRQGVLPSELDAMLTELKKYPDIKLRSVYSHFANIEDTTDLTHALTQAKVFGECYAQVEAAGWERLPRHESATSGLMAYEDGNRRNTLLRLGLGIYGLYPSPALEQTHKALKLRPAMRWVTHLAQVKTLPAGHPVGYGLTYVTSQDTKIGIVPQGYSDGYDRGLSSRGQVLVHGQRCPVLGRIAMNMFAVDLTHVSDVKVEDEVVLLGEQGEDRITAEEIAELIGTINYEITTRVSPLLPRVVV